MAMTAFTNARIFDGIAAEYTRDSCVVVEDSRIVEVAPHYSHIPGPTSRATPPRSCAGRSPQASHPCAI
jgi:hypothetical protein